MEEKWEFYEEEIKSLNESNDQLLFKIKQYEDSGAILPD